MAAKRKKTKGRTKRYSFKPGSLRRKKKSGGGLYSAALSRILRILAISCAVTAVGIGVIYAAIAGFRLLEKYAKKSDPASQITAVPKLVNPPDWLNEPLKQEILSALTAFGEDLKPDEDAAESVQYNIESLISWAYDVRVRTTRDSLFIEAKWRKPLAIVKLGLEKFYVDAEMVVLDYVPMPHLPIVKVKGLAVVPRTPPTGKVWDREDLAAAVAVLNLLDRRDRLDPSAKPLLNEIDSIDISNFKGRENARFPHIVLYAKDNTEIIWGAELGDWVQHLEAKDENKLAKLYGYYKEYGSLQSGDKYINLRDPLYKVPLPIDKY